MLVSICMCPIDLRLSSLQLAYLYTVHVSPRNIAPLLGFAGASMTLLKTTIWVLQEYFCGACSMSDKNQFSDIFKFWICPNMCVVKLHIDRADHMKLISFNSLWFSFCTLIVARLGGDISSSLNRPSSKAKCS
jgi:hypothetical protein